MPSVDIKITNLPQIRAAFSRAPLLMAQELDKAIQLTVLNIQRKSMINTPVLTGRLRASTSSKFSHLRGEVGTHTNYDIFVHEGTRFMPARPYLRDAVEEANIETNKMFQSAVQSVLDTIGRSV